MSANIVLYKNEIGCEILACLPEGSNGDDLWIAEIRSQIANWNSESLFVSINTSGSTGQPKSIQLSKRAMRESAERTAKYFQLESGSRSVLCLPAKYIAGLMMIVRSIVNGWKLYCIEPALNVDVSSILSIDFIAMTPSQAVSSFDSSHPYGIERINNVLLGGGAVDLGLMRKIELLSNAFYHSYGMTETCTHVAIRRLNGENAKEHFEALEGIHFAVDENSCLIIHSDYLDEPTYQTNDIVSLDSSKEFIWKGRYDFVINSGGIKLFPEQIEQKIKEVFPELIFFVSSEFDQLLGEKLSLIVDLSSYYNNIDILNVLKLSKKMSKYELPKSIHLVPKIYFTSSGKIKRQKDLYLRPNI